MAGLFGSNKSLITGKWTAFTRCFSNLSTTQSALQHKVVSPIHEHSYTPTARWLLYTSHQEIIHAILNNLDFGILSKYTLTFRPEEPGIEPPTF